ncbi:MAG: Ig-like domain-containing protein [Gemmatimonadaceae bacterium]|nr:Ig-like domain-containing protein [Chitinophagaceae bacterium]
MGIRFFLAIGLITAVSCKKTDNDPAPSPGSGTFSFVASSINGNNSGSFTYQNISTNPEIRLSFSAPVDRNTATAITLAENSGGAVATAASFANSDSTVILKPAAMKAFLTYLLTLPVSLKSKSGTAIKSTLTFTLKTGIDSSRKFPLITDDALLTLVQQQTFKYFWDFGHPVSGLSRERNNSNDVVTSGGSGFGIMAIVTGIHRGFITRAEGLARIQKMAGFLKTAQKFHGAFPHWLNGATGNVVPFSQKDNGADLVETSYLMQGLLTARQYFNGADPAETTLRNDINTLYNGVEWSWFRKGAENVLYWHWSPDYNWEMNLPIRGWNECLITYALAASSPTYGIPPSVYTSGWAVSPSFVNGNTYYGYKLPLGPVLGGPLFFAHYSFLGINPNGLTDSYGNYFEQNKNHTLINYNYSRANLKGHYGYSDSVWGLTASDIPNGYTASSPTNDIGVIAPTAALSSFPYTPTESMQALKFYYYVLGDKIWKEYGFVDAFALKDPWFASSFLAIDQGPIIIMIENHRSKLLWNLFMSCPEVKTGMKVLGFQSPYF